MEVIKTPRKNREYSESGYYHIILRGINRQDIFIDDNDRLKFLSVMNRYAEEQNAWILAFCLMDNHVHFLIHLSDEPGLFIKKIASSYVFYFNHKYERIGHLFQDRYKSVAIGEDEYLLTAFRYILQNPQKAGICKASDYRWSNWKEIEKEAESPKMQVLINLAGGLDALIEYLLFEDNSVCYEEETHHSITDREALDILFRISGVKDPMKIGELPKEHRDTVLEQMKRTGCSIRQISRLTGIGRNIIQRVNESRGQVPRLSRGSQGKNESTDLSP